MDLMLFSAVLLELFVFVLGCLPYPDVPSFSLFYVGDWKCGMASDPPKNCSLVGNLNLICSPPSSSSPSSSGEKFDTDFPGRMKGKPFQVCIFVISAPGRDECFSSIHNFEPNNNTHVRLLEHGYHHCKPCWRNASSW